jgi:hypothetical protein
MNGGGRDESMLCAVLGMGAGVWVLEKEKVYMTRPLIGDGRVFV